MQQTDWSAHWRTISSNMLFSKICSLYFIIYQRLLRGITIKQPRILELGAGSGGNTVRLLKCYGGSALLLDNNINAKKMFDCQKKGLRAEYKLADIWKLKAAERFDIVHSEGLVEHFHGRQRHEIFDMHARWLKKGGYAVILAPVRCIAYRLMRAGMRARGQWHYTDEVPFTVQEMAERAEAAGLHVLRTVKLFWMPEAGILCRKSKARQSDR